MSLLFLVQAGTLKIGDYVLAGTCSGKVKAMQDERGNIIKEVGPSTTYIHIGIGWCSTSWGQV